jgi:hypothetical protein
MTAHYNGQRQKPILCFRVAAHLLRDHQTTNPSYGIGRSLGQRRAENPAKKMIRIAQDKQ